MPKRNPDAHPYHRQILFIHHAMKARCLNPKATGYEYYGGRGILICQEWLESYESFEAWALLNGYKPGLSIDRISNDAGYTPENCRWATQQQQIRNRRNSVWVTAFGETKLAAEWAKDPRCKASERTLKRRLADGMDPESSISNPPLNRGLAARNKSNTRKMT